MSFNFLVERSALEEQVLKVTTSINQAVKEVASLTVAVTQHMCFEEDGSILESFRQKLEARSIKQMFEKLCLAELPIEVRKDGDRAGEWKFSRSRCVELCNAGGMALNKPANERFNDEEHAQIAQFFTIVLTKLNWADYKTPTLGSNKKAPTQKGLQKRVDDAIQQAKENGIILNVDLPTKEKATQKEFPKYGEHQELMDMLYLRITTDATAMAMVVAICEQQMAEAVNG